MLQRAEQDMHSGLRRRETMDGSAALLQALREFGLPSFSVSISKASTISL